MMKPSPALHSLVFGLVANGHVRIDGHQNFWGLDLEAFPHQLHKLRMAWPLSLWPFKDPRPHLRINHGHHVLEQNPECSGTNAVSQELDWNNCSKGIPMYRLEFVGYKSQPMTSTCI